MATITHLSEHDYRELALNDPDHRWELWDGVLVEKPLMSMRHDAVSLQLGCFPCRVNSIARLAATRPSANRRVHWHAAWRGGSRSGGEHGD